MSEPSEPSEQVRQDESAVSPSKVVVDTSKSPFVRLRPVPLDKVRLDDFWAPRRKMIGEVTLPAQYRLLDETGRLDNFRRAAGRLEGAQEGFYFNDSDVYKWLEAASWMLASDDDSELAELVDRTIELVGAAQQPDGYLDTFYSIDNLDARWTELERTHELYCAGHLIQAAVAHHRATGQTSLLDIAVRFADLICDTFGPDGPLAGTDGHPEIEMALVELARDTGDDRYLKQARYFLDIRGQDYAGGDPYHQDHQPFRELDALVGHAVRALYLCAGAADIYAETDDPALLATLERLWRSLIARRLYVTGGAGSRHEGEALGEDFELPNERAYTETCAGIALFMWGWRMLQLDGEAAYADLMERALYNAILPGISLDGLGYFYVNPLAAGPEHRRQPWFECACCPPNIARLIASLPGYLYSHSDDDIWVHFYAGSAVELALGDGRTVRLRQRSGYPWDGDVSLEVETDGIFTLHLRIPGWCESGARLDINGEPYDGELIPGSYLALRRSWHAGDRLRLSLPMRAQRIETHPYVSENTGKVALARGPLIYCLEAVDHPGVDLRDIVLPFGTGLDPIERTDLLGGIVCLEADALIDAPDPGWSSRLYRTAQPRSHGLSSGAIRLRAIPYFAWANREPGRMQVWIRGLSDSA